MIGLEHTAASTASLLLNLEGVFTALLAGFVFREIVDGRVALGMVAIVAGSVVLSWQGNLTTRDIIGPLAIAGACLAWGLDNNLTQRVSAGDPVQVAMLKGLIAGAVNLAIALALGNRLPPMRATAGALGVGFLSYGLSLVLFVLALRRLGTARTGAYFTTAPFVGAIASLVLFRDPLTPSLALAGICMAVGVWLHATERHHHEHVHEPFEHELSMSTTTNMGTPRTIRRESLIATRTGTSDSRTRTLTIPTSTTVIRTSDAASWSAMPAE